MRLGWGWRTHYPEGLYGCGQKALVLPHRSPTRGLLPYPYDMSTGFPQSEWPKKGDHGSKNITGSWNYQNFPYLWCSSCKRSPFIQSWILIILLLLGRHVNIFFLKVRYDTVFHCFPCFSEAVPSEREPTSRTKALLTSWLKCVQTGCLGKKILVKINHLGGMGTWTKGSGPERSGGMGRAYGIWSWRRWGGWASRGSRRSSLPFSTFISLFPQLYPPVFLNIITPPPISKLPPSEMSHNKSEPKLTKGK